jgi:succinyl-diaminopimelate desuccinylase
MNSKGQSVNNTLPGIVKAASKPFSFPTTMDEEVVELCSRLVSIPSFNPPGNELEIATFVHSYLQQAGLQSELIFHTPQRASILAGLAGRKIKKSLLFSAHMDTVPVGAEQWEHPPYQAQLSEGKIWGRGTADMKGGLAAIMVAARVIAASKIPLAGDLVLALSAGEEVNMLGANAMANRPELQNLQGMLVAEPTSNDLIIAEKGILWLVITTTGKTAHGSMPEYGRNAVRMMLTLINELDRLDFPFEEHPLLGKFSASLNTIHGGIQTNIVPDQCQISIDMRTVPGQVHTQIIQKIQALIDTLHARDADFSAAISITQDGAALATDPNDPLVSTLQNIMARVTGQTPTPKGVRYFTDAAIYASHVPAPLVICGPGPTEMAHQPDEYVEVEKLKQAARIYTLAAHELLQE